MRIPVTALLLATFGMWSMPARGATLIWDTDTLTSGAQDGAGNWTVGGATFWNGVSNVATVNDLFADVAQFGNGGVGGTVNVASQSIRGLLFGATTTTGYTLTNSSASTLTIGNSGITVSSGAQPVTVGSANLGLALGTNATFANNSTGLFTVGGAINTAGNGLTIDGVGNTTVSGIISGAGTLTKNGAADLNLNGVNTSTGTITLNGGKIIVGAAAKLSGAAAVNINSGGTLQITGGTNAIDDGSVVTVNTGGTLLLNGGATETISRLAGAGTVDRTIAGNQTLTVNSTTSNTFSGIIQNTGGGTLSLTKTNTNTLTLTGTSTYTGATTINRGVITVSALQNAGVASPLGMPIGTTSDIVFNNNTASQTSGLTYAGTTAASTNRQIALALGATGAATHTMTISNTSTAAGASLTFISALKNTTATGSPTLAFGGTNPAADVNEFQGALINSTGTGTPALKVSKTGTNTWKLSGTNTYTGVTTVTAGTLIFGKQVSLYNNTPASWTATNLTVSSGATLGLNVGGAGEFTSGNVATIAALGTATNGFLGGSAIGLDTTNATGNFVHGTAITNTNAGANALGLTKLGTGTLELTAANTYTGTTTVNAGTLLVSGAGTIGSGGVTMVGGTLDLGGTSPTVGAVSITGASTIQNGSLSGTSYAASLTTGAATVTANLLANGAAGLTKSGAGILSVSGNNTFTGGITMSAGTLQFSTVSNNGGAASSLGQGTDGISLGGGVLSFIGSSSQSSNRAITGTAASTLDASGTSGATISWTGAISTGGNTLTLAGTGAGSITGGITQTGTAADLSPSSGTWTFSGGTLLLADDFINSGPTVVTNINTTGMLTYTTGTSNGLYSRNGATVNLNADDVNGAANSGGLDFILVGDIAGTPATLNTNTFAITTPRLDVGAGAVLTGEGNVIGAGTITVTTNLNLYRGSIAANLTGAAAVLKQGSGTITLSGDGSGLTGATTLSRGSLVLDYTTSNTGKLSDTAALTALGGTLTLNGNASGATSETLGSVTIGIGASHFNVNNGTGQTAALNVGALTRSVIGGTLDVALSSGSASVATSSTNGSGAILGGYATVGGSSFATVSGGNITAFTSTAKDDVSTWVAGDDVTDSTGFINATNNLNINSLRFNAAGATSTVTINADNRLNIASSGILVTPAVGSGAASITGGILSGGTALNEIIIHQNNTTTPFVIGSALNGGTALTKSGAGTLTLSGSNNTFHGTINLNEGTLIPSGGKAIGDFSLVAMKSNTGVTLDLNNGTETIGGLSSTTVFSTTGFEDGTVAVGSGTLTINLSSATRTYQGTVTGNGSIIKNGANQQQFFGANGGFTGSIVVNQGLLDLSEGALVLNTASSITINGPGEVISDQETGASVDHIGNATAITLNNTAVARGLWIRNADQGATRSDTVGAVTLGFGHNVIQVDENGAGASSGRILTATAASLDRGTNHATLLVRGQMMGLTSGERGQLIFTAAPTGAVGGGGAAATTTMNILPYLVGESAAMTDATLTDNYGNSFVFNTGTTNGLRPLDLTTEYTLNQAGYDALTGVATNNVRFAINPTGTLAGTAVQINSLVLDSSTEAISVAGPASSLNIKSGAILATTTTPANAMTLGGFTGLTTDAGNDYIVYVTNPTSTLTLNTPLKTDSPLVKAGAGTLVLGAVNSSTDLYLNQGLVQVDAVNKLGTGGVNFYGGGLRWASGATFDPSATKTMNFGTGGGTLDTNGNSITLANAIGNGGIGGLTKTGTGTLTLGAPVTYTGTTTVTAGTLQFGVSAALPTSGTVIMNGGTLDTAGFVTALGSLSVQASSTLTGSANVAFSGDSTFGGGGARTLTVNNSGTTTLNGSYLALVDAGTTARTQTIAGTGAVTINSEIQDGTAAGSLTITNINTTTLAGHNTYSGTTTMNAAAGTLVFSGDNRTAGATTLTAGTLQFNSALNGGIASGLLTLTAGTLQAVNAARTLSNNVNLTAATVSGTQSLTISGTLTGVTGGSRTLDSSISGGTLALGDIGINAETANARTLTIAGTGATTVNGIISNGNGTTNNGLIITNTNTTTLAGANTYSGDTTISFGTTKLGNSNVIPDGAGKGNVSIAAGATLDLNGKSESLNGLSGAGSIDSTAAGAMLLTVGGNDQTSSFSGTLANTAGTLNLTKTGTGDLTLTGTSTYSGSTTVNGGKLYIDSAAGFPSTTSGLTLADGAEFHLRGTNPLANVVKSFSGSGNVVTVGSTTGGVLGFGIDGLFNTQLNLAAGQTMTVNGTLTTAIHVNNAPTAGTPYVLINAADDNAIFGSGTFDLNPVVFNGGSFTYALSKVLAGPGEQWVLTPTAVAAAADVWWRGDLGGIGTGVWSASTTSGTGFPTNWDTDQASGIDAAVPPDSGSIVHFSATGATNLATTLGANLTIQELIVHSGGSAVSVGGANTLTIGNATDAAGITLQTGAPNLSFSSNVALAKAQSFNVADAASLLTFTGALSGTGPLGINDNGSSTGTVILGGAAGIATYSGATNLVAGKLVLQGGANNRLPTTTALTMGNATLGATLQLGDATGASNTTIGTLNTGAATTNAIVGGFTSASTLTVVQSAAGDFNGTIGGAGTNENQVALTKQGSATLTLNGANTYTGATTVNNGILKLGSTGSLSGTASLTVNANAGVTAAFDVNGRTVTLGGALTLGGASTTSKADILDTASGGTININGGLIYDATNNPLGSVIDAKIASPGNRTFTVNDSTSTTNELTFNGTVANAGSITIAGAGNGTINAAWTVSGTNISNTFNSTGTWNFNATTNTTNTGDWNINSGVINATVTNALNAADDIIIDGTGVQDSAIVNISGSAGTSGIHQGDDFFIRNGGRVNVLVNNGISTGTDSLLIGDSASVGAAAAGRLDLAANINVGANGVLLGAGGGQTGNITGTGTITTAGGYSVRNGNIEAGITLSGGSLTKVSDGTVTFSGTRTAGNTNIQEGSLVLDYTTNNASKIAGVLTLGAAQGNLTSPTSLVINGNASAPTVQSVTSTTISNTGNVLIDINEGAGQTASLALGAITRSVVGGTVAFDYASASAGATTTSAATNTLGWATVTTGGTTRIAAIDGSGNIVQGTTVAENSVGLWTDNANIINTAGYTGTITDCATIASLTFDAAAASTVGIGTGKYLNITSGGILVNSSVGSFASTISGGSIYGANSGTPGELIVQQNNAAAPLTISSAILASSGITKSGAGILVLSGSNNFLATGSRLTINEGTVRVAGGNAIGDNTTVIMRAGGSLDLNGSSETIGNLGVDTTNFSAGGIDLGAGTLTVNQTASSSFIGSFTGTNASKVIKNGTGTLTIQGNSPGFTGTVQVDAGQVSLTGNFTQFSAATAIVLNGAGSLSITQDQDASVNRVNNSATVTLNNTALGSGLSLTDSDNTASNGENVGALTLGAGHNIITATSSQASTVGTLTISSLAARNNRATLLVRGAGLGDSATAQRGQIIFTTAPTSGNAVIGGGGAAGTTNTNIFAWMVGETSATGVGNSFVRNTGTTNGVKPLDLATEYISDSTTITGTLTDNIRYTATAAITATPTAINSLVLDSATGVALTGSASPMEITSGALLAAGAGSHSIGGITALTTGSTRDYNVFVTNAAGVLSIDSALTTLAPLVKSGAGTLKLTSTSNANNAIYLNHGTLLVDDLDKTGTGTLNFFGGTFKLDTTFTDDIGAKTMVVGTGGGTLDIGALNITATSWALSGSGALTKTGTGTLTIGNSTTITHTGQVIVSQGSLVLNNATGNAIGTGGLLISGTSNPTTVQLTQSNQITNTAPVILTNNGSNNQTLDLNNFSDTVGAVTLTSTSTTGTVIKTGATGVLTLNGDLVMNNNRGNDGATTEFQNLITGSGDVATRTTDGTLDLGGVNRRITVESTVGNPNRNDAVIETVIQNGGIIKAGSRALYLTNNNTYAGPTNIQQGTVVISSSQNLGDGSLTNGVTLANGSTLRSTGANVDLGVNRTLTLDGVIGGTLDVTGSNKLTVSGPVVGADCMALTKSSSGTLVLSNDSNSYAGGTNVAQGTLLVNNSNPASSGTGGGSVTIAAGATLGGTGSVIPAINNSVTVNGTLRPGDPALTTGSDLNVTVSGTGTLSLLGVVDMTLYENTANGASNPATSNSMLAVGASNWDRLVFGPGSTLKVSLAPSVSTSGWALGTEFQLFDWSAILGGTMPSASSFATLDLPSLDSGLEWNTSNIFSSGTITIAQIVPEPGRALLLMLGIAALLVRRRRTSHA